jgi:hypothetical protein
MFRTMAASPSGTVSKGGLVQIQRRPSRPAPPPLDLRTPSGRRTLPY